MEIPTDFYKKQLEVYTSLLKEQRKKLRLLSTFRLLVFLVTGFLMYWFWQPWQVAVIFGIVGTALFLYLISIYTDLRNKKRFSEAMIALNEKELQILGGDFYNEPHGENFKDAKHYYSLDIDLFGVGSFFQYTNRTRLPEGTRKFADILTENSIDGIGNKQDAIKELASKPEFRQEFTAASSLIKTETTNEAIVKWLLGYKPFTHSFFLILSWAITGLSAIVLVLVLNNVISASILGYILTVGLLLTGRYLKKVSDLSANTDKARDTFRQYAVLLSAIETQEFTAGVLKEKQQQIAMKGKQASAIFKQFSKLLDALDSRNNIIGAIMGNGFFLMDLRNSYRIEKWIAVYGDKITNWFDTVAWFDAYNTLGNYAFNHPEYCYPEITNNDVCIKANSLGHPLLKKEKRVDNDLLIDNTQFLIITGANMAGKSTFLRTVSLHIVMANIGLPVCAKSSLYTPVKLITSMRTSDSLTDDSSYFFSELTRLKYIVDALETNSYFIILDEILKGTNSTDKAIGSRKFVEKLVKANATGIIATHDLSLCELETEIPQVKNHYFDAEIVNDELYFDYTFKDGVCKNMNASFLLRKMQIIDK
ncbi:hypothetical protein NBRC110019_31140 [Neptunitalea chrysea]|uniref:DNA mismatch repair proteins mutS family domain-containing protein n=1 Tax=Neptunitalea chrysea TaxID=1647581 RepID=A0A9W6B9M4_9FLAO|nr:DNA mismatch repair protein MutS [Neptunitalea chrysea]GLB54073.1 hypothetical protein NBRC110019_31140 [Neptunitalea chrysea]